MTSDKVRAHHLERKALLYVGNLRHIKCCTIVRVVRFNTPCVTG